MENTIKRELVISTQDHDTLKQYLQKNTMDLNYDRVQAAKLSERLKSAHVVNNNDLDRDTIGLNSIVTIRYTIARLNQTHTLGLPGDRVHQNDSLSVISPLGMALLGRKKGDSFTLKTARGNRIYTITEVYNPVD